MKRLLNVMLIALFCFNLSACKNNDNSQSNNPSNISEASDSNISSKTDNESEIPESLDDKNQFQLLEIDYDNNIALNKNIATLLTDKELPYKIDTKEFARKNHKGELNVEYPIFTNGDKDMKQMNDLIYSLVSKHVSKEDDINKVIDITINYEIKKSSDNIVSILFTGMANSKTAAHPLNICFTFNYDLTADKIIDMTDIVEIDCNFLKKCKGAMEKQFDNEIYDAILSENGNINKVISELKGVNSKFYFQDSKFYVGFSVPIGSKFTDFVSFCYD